MKLNIAICDDSKTDPEFALDLLKAWTKERLTKDMRLIACKRLVLANARLKWRIVFALIPISVMTRMMSTYPVVKHKR